MLTRILRFADWFLAGWALRDDDRRGGSLRRWAPGQVRRPRGPRARLVRCGHQVPQDGQLPALGKLEQWEAALVASDSTAGYTSASRRRSSRPLRFPVRPDDSDRLAA